MSVSPNITLNLGSGSTTSVFPSGTVPLELTFANTGTAPGYGPFIALNLGTAGLSLPATMTTNLGQTVTPVLLTNYSAALGGFIIPGTSANGPAVVPAASASQAVYLLELPFGSFAGGQTPVQINTTLTLPANAAIPTTDGVSVTGGFQFGSVPTANAPIYGTSATANLQTSLISVVGTQSGDPTLGGPANVLNYAVYGDVALNATVYNLSLTDPLPPEALVSNFTVSDGKGDSWKYTVQGGVIISAALVSGSGAAPVVTTAANAASASVPNVYYDLASNSITANFGQYTGESTSTGATTAATAPSISANFTLPSPVLGTASGSSTGTGDLQVTDELPVGATAQTFSITGNIVASGATPASTYTDNYTVDAAGNVTLASSTGTGPAVTIQTAGAGAAGGNWVYYDKANGKIEADFGAGLPAGSTGSITAAWQGGQPQSPGYISNAVSVSSSTSNYTVNDQLAGGQTINTVTVSNGGATNTYSVDASGTLTLVGANNLGIGIGQGNGGSWIYYDTANNRVVTDFGTVTSANNGETFTVNASNSGSTEINQNSSQSQSVSGIGAPSAGYSSASGAAAAITTVEGTPTNGPSGSNEVTANLVTLSKSVAAPANLHPGDDLAWTITGHISDYANVNNVVVTDTLASGQHFDASVTPTLNVKLADGTNATVNFSSSDYTTSVDATTGVTTITYSVSKEMIDSAIGTNGGLDGGAAPTDGSVNPVGASFTIDYSSTVDPTYTGTTAFPTTPAVDQGDKLGNGASLAGLTVGTGTAVSAHADAAAAIPTGTLVKTVYAINGVLVNAANETAGLISLDGNGNPMVKDGDVVTYDLKYTLPQTNTTDLSLTDYMPLPVFNVANADGSGDALAFVANPTNAFAAGTVTFGPTENITGTETVATPTIIDNANTNSFSVDLGAFSPDANYDPSVVDLLVSSVVIDTPFVNGLNLTNEVTSTETPSEAAPIVQNKIAMIDMVAPVLQVYKSVTSISGSGANTEGLTGSTSATTMTGASGLFNVDGSFKTTISDSNIGKLADSAKGAQGGDTVTFAVAVQNTGDAAAFNIALKDALPTGITLADISNITLTNGAGQALDVVGGSAALANLFSTGVTLAPNDGLAPSTTTVAGSDIALITYTVTLPTNISMPDLTETNKATVSSFTAESAITNPTAVNFAGTESSGSLTASANIVTAQPSISKVVASTALSGTGADKTTLQVGEQVTYTVTTTLNEGTYTDLKLQDAVPSGLTNVVISNVVVGSNISTTNSPALAGSAASGATTTADFGLTTVAGAGANAGSAADQITFTVTGDATAPVSSGTVAGGATTTVTNTADVYALNSAGGSKTSSSSAPVKEIAPNLSLAKWQADLTQQSYAPGTLDAASPTYTQSLITANAGDEVQYKLVLSDASNTNPAFNVNIADAIATEFGSKVTLDAGSIKIYGPTGTEDVADEASISAAGGNVAAQIAEIDAGKNYTVVFDATVTSTDTFGTALDNSASFSGQTLASTTLGASETIAGKSNTVDINTSLPTSTKQLTGTSDSNITAPSLAPGDIGTFTVKIAVPEGASPDLSVQDLLPTGMTYVAGSAVITAVNGALTTDGTTALTNANMVESGITGGFKLDFGSVVATAGSSPTITLTYQAVLTNSLTAATTLTNTLNTYSGSTQVASTTAPVDVIVPNLAITKSVAADASNPTTATQGNNPLDNGNYLEDYTITVSAGAGDNAPAYDLSISDAIPSGITVVGPIVASVGTAVLNPNGTITLSNIDNSTGSAFLPTSAPITIKYSAYINDASAYNQTITNTATVTYSSAPSSSPTVAPLGGDTLGPVSNSASFTVPAGSLSGHIFLDYNNNGVEDTSTAGNDTNLATPSVSVELYKNGVDTGLSTTTNAQGAYNFGNLSQGEYSVKFTLPSGYAGFSQVGGSSANGAVDSVVNTSGATANVMVYAGENTPNQNAGVYKLGSLSGEVFFDTNEDGQLNNGEQPIAAVKVELFNNGTDTGLFTTAQNTGNGTGTYQFTGLTPGDAYSVKVIAPVGDIITVIPTTPTSTVYNHADANGDIQNIPVYSGTDTGHNDAGVAAPATVQGMVFFDGQCDSTYHIGDAGVAGVTVELVYANGPNQGSVVTNALGQAVTTTTDNEGQYIFKNLLSGDYAVQVAAPAGTNFSDTEVLNGGLLHNDVSNAGTSYSFNLAPGGSETISAGLEFNGNFNGQTPTVLSAGQQYASLTGGNVIVGAGGNNVHTGSPGNNVVALDGNGNIIELGLSSTSTEDIGTSCGTLQAQTQAAANGFLFAGGTGSSYLDGGSGNSYLMGGTGANQIYSGSGNNTIIAGGNGSLITTGGLSTTIYYQAGDGLLTIDNGLRSGKDTLTIYGYAGGTITTVNGIQQLNLGNGDVVEFVGPTPFVNGAIDNTNDAGTGLTFNLTGTATPIMELSFGANDMPVFTAPGGAVPPAPAPTPAPTPAPVVTPTPPGPVVLPVPVVPAPVVIPTAASGSTVTETNGGQTLVLDNTVSTLKLFGYGNNVTDTNGGVVVTGDDGNSTFNLTGGNNTLVVQGYGDTIAMGGADNAVFGTLGNSSITLTGNGTVDTYGYGDTIALGDGTSEISGIAGSSTIVVGNAAAPGVNGGTMALAGNSNVVTTYAASGSWAITAGNGSDTVNINGGTDTVALAGWQNIVTVSAGSAAVSGGDQNTYAVLNTAGSFNIADFNTALGDVLDLTALHVSPGSITLAATATGTEVYVTTGIGHPTIGVANLTGVTPASLVQGHSLLV